jgi:PAS domain S-box-containing protein
MLESELFALLERTADAAYAVTDDGTICSWNAAATRLFGHDADEAIGRNVDDVLKARDALGTEALAGGLDAATRGGGANGAGNDIANFDLEVLTQNRGRIWINVSTIVFDNPRTRRRLFIRLARDVTQRKQREAQLNRMADVARQVVLLADDAPELAPVNPLSDQERRILKLFADGSDPAAIARRLSISGQTLRNHLHHINRKLRTHNRLEAVTHAQRRGLLD